MCACVCVYKYIYICVCVRVCKCVHICKKFICSFITCNWDICYCVRLVFFLMLSIAVLCYICVCVNNCILSVNAHSRIIYT